MVQTPCGPKTTRSLGRLSLLKNRVVVSECLMQWQSLGRLIKAGATGSALNDNTLL